MSIRTAAAARTRSQNRHRSAAALKAKGYSSHSAYRQQAEVHLYPGLRKAGIPEQ